jgi:hypothetical protein
VTRPNFSSSTNLDGNHEWRFEKSNMRQSGRRRKAND